MQTINTEQITLAIHSQEIIDGIAELSQFVNEPSLGVEINPLGLYCQKTGALVGLRETNSLFSFLKIREKSSFVWSFFNATSFNVHPAWLETSGEDLDCLIDSDPVGYACYCFGIITAHFYQTNRGKEQDLRKPEYAQKYWAMARAHALMTARGVAGLDELNVELCRFLTYAKGAKGTEKYLFKKAGEMAQSPDMLAMLHVSGELVDLLHECVNRVLNSIGYADRYIHATRFVDFAATPADAARGPSNIRKQKVSKRDVKEQTMFNGLRDMFNDAGLEGLGVFKAKASTDKRADFSRFQKTPEDNEASMIADLAMFGGTNLDIFGAEDDGEDNEVEVIVPPVTPMEAEQFVEGLAQMANEFVCAGGVAVTEIAPENTLEKALDFLLEYKEPEPQKPMTLFERMRAQRGK